MIDVQLCLVYLGYGVIGGIGLRIGYISPVSTLIKWFPDRPGLATGLAIMGFGGGALIAGPLSRQLLSFYDSGYDPERRHVGGLRERAGRAVPDARHRLLRHHDVRRRQRAGAPARTGGRRASTRRRSPRSRFAWSSTSDLIGRTPIYMIYLGGGMVLYALLASVGHTATALFVLLAGVILSFHGGGSRPFRRTCATCSAPTRSAPSTVGC